MEASRKAVELATKELTKKPGSNLDGVLAKELATQMDITTRTTRSTKRTAARIAIMNVIRSKLVGPGELLPSEKDLAIILGVSLGTVQAALRGLQDIGTIVRRRGDGTRVATIEPFGETIWHFRFMSRKNGMPLRIIDQKTWVDIISDTGVWSDYLGLCTHYVRIRRVLTLQDGVHTGAEMFLDASAAKGLENIDAQELVHASIRPYLEETFGLSTNGVSHLVKTTSLDKEVAEVFGLRAQGDYYEIHAKAFANDQRPIYFQRIYVSASDCALMF